MSGFSNEITSNSGLMRVLIVDDTIAYIAVKYMQQDLNKFAIMSSLSLEINISS
jgi:hypothetical protein